MCYYYTSINIDWLEQRRRGTLIAGQRCMKFVIAMPM